MGKSEIVISKPSYSEIGDQHQVAARFRGPGIDHEVWFRSRTPFSRESPYTEEAFFAAGVYPAMRQRLALRSEGAISGRMLHSMAPLQDIVAKWYPDFREIDIVADTAPAAPASATPSGSAFFFSGGADSFHTYLGNREKLSHAIFVHGADIELERVEFRGLVSKRLQEAAREMGVEMIEVETNLLDFTEQYCTWGAHFHGAGLAAIAKLFSGLFREVTIASSYPSIVAKRWGSHPMTDPLWSSEGFEVVHHGAGATRLEKIAEIAESDLAMRFVRVCWENVEGEYNCCRCEKCMRTMAALRILGKLEQCPAFPQALDCSLIPGIRYTGEGNRVDWVWNMMAVRDVDDPELESAMQQMDEANAVAAAVKEFARHSKELLASPEWLRLLPKQRNKLFRNLKEHDEGWFAEKVIGEVGGRPQEAFDQLWKRRRKWLKAELRAAERRRRAGRLRSALRRLGIGTDQGETRERR